MVVVSQDDVLGSSDLSTEWDELKKKYEVFEKENYVSKKELVELWVKVTLVDLLQEELDQYGSPSTLLLK